MKTKKLALLLLLSSCWGPSFLFIKVAVAEISPLMLSALRIAIGALIINLFLLVRRETLPLNFNFWKKAAVAGFFAQGLPFTLINWGEQYVDSSLASILNGLTPLFTIILAQIMLEDEKMTGNKVKGVMLGFIGLVILVLPSLLSGVTATVMGISAISLAAISYAIGLVYVRKHLINTPKYHAPAAQLLSVTLYLLPIALLADPEVSFSSISWHAIGSLVMLGSFGTALAFIIYFKLIEKAGAGYTSMVTYLMPIYGVMLGVFFLNEQLTPETIGGMICIMSGIYLVNVKSSSVFRFKKPVDTARFSKFR